MLVLSRRPNERIVFPGLNVAVQVVSVKSSVVRLGIEAPEDVTICREEVLGKFAAGEPAAAPPSREERHAVQNRLNALNIGLTLLREQVNAGMTASCLETVDKLREEYEHLRRQLERNTPAAAPPARRARVRKALLVEDDQNEREFLAGFLRLAGIDVATAGDGSAALDYLRSAERPDVVLLDMVLPLCDGPTTLREIRRNPSYDGLRIFAMTGHARERFRLDGRVDGWFQKPFNPQDLLRRLQEEHDKSA